MARIMQSGENSRRSIEYERDVSLMTKFLAVVAILVVAAVPACASTWQVSLVNIAFSPADITIGLNDTVHWVWQDGGIPHSTTSDPGQTELWDSGIHSGSFTFDHSFTNVGTFRYYCDVHGDVNGSGMSGSVRVVPEPSSLLALASGLGGLGGILQRRRRR